MTITRTSTNVPLGDLRWGLRAMVPSYRTILLGIRVRLVPAGIVSWVGDLHHLRHRVDAHNRGGVEVAVLPLDRNHLVDEWRSPPPPQRRAGWRGVCSCSLRRARACTLAFLAAPPLLLLRDRIIQ